MSEIINRLDVRAKYEEHAEIAAAESPPHPLRIELIDYLRDQLDIGGTAEERADVDKAFDVVMAKVKDYEARIYATG